MRAAQDQVDRLTDVPAGLSAALGDAFAALPPTLRGVIVVLVVLGIVGRWAGPPLLKAIADFIIVLKASTRISDSKDWVEALRITRGEQRRMIGRRAVPEPDGEAPDPKPTSGGTPKSRSQEETPAGGDEDDPP